MPIIHSGFTKKKYATEEWKSDKQPNGNHHHPTDFLEHEINLISDDRVYLFSDGFQDQFGTASGKKLMQKGFKEALLISSKMELNDHYEFLRSSIEQWKLNLNK